MNREDYLRELDAAGQTVHLRLHEIGTALRPANVVRRRWKWWLSGASLPGFALARFCRCSSRQKSPSRLVSAAAGGAAFWVPLLLKTAPTILRQLLPLFLSFQDRPKG